MTGIGKTVNGFRKHCSELVGNFARHLVTKWKQLVQLTTEVISETHCAASAPDDLLITADGEKISRLDHHHLETSSSKHKQLSADGTTTASKHHSSADVKSGKRDKQNDDKISSKRCSESKVCDTSVTFPFDSDQLGYGSNSSHSHSASQISVHMDQTTECQQLSAGDLQLLNSEGAICGKSGHKKYHKLSKHTADDKNKEKCSSHNRLPATSCFSKSASHREHRISQSHHTNCDGSATDRMLHKGEKLSLPKAYDGTDLKKSEPKDVSESMRKAGHKVSEKKSHNAHISDRASQSNASASSNARTQNPGHILELEHKNYVDTETFTTTDDVDNGESKGMTFEQMLNYDNHHTVAKKKKSIDRHVAGKHSKVHKSASDSGLLTPSSMTRHSSEPYSELMSKRISHVLKTYENDDSEISQLNQQPVIPQPDSQVSECSHTDTITSRCCHLFLHF